LYEGFVDAAMKTALHLREYEDMLNQVFTSKLKTKFLFAELK
jgi:hypothetical protein